MQKSYFGTDGIRGQVGQFPMEPMFILKLGWAIGKFFSEKKRGRIVLGKDTRISGYMFESALEAGISAAGIDINILGPMPTPAIAYLTRTLKAQLGVVISASHNPFYDNGIKFFSADGFKVPDNIEFSIEQHLALPFHTVGSADLGKAIRVTDAPGRYIEFCKSCVPHYTDLQGLKIAIDCANGATYYVAPKVFEELGANVITLCAKPNGLNINEGCGAIHPEMLQQFVRKENVDLGIIFDGDGDRVLMVDHKGEIVDGDELLFIIIKNRLANKIKFGGVVGTQMTNMGMELDLKELRIPFQRAPVGERHVMAALAEKKWLLGGEPSGHIICLDDTTTADGIIAALQVLQALTDSGKNLHEMKKEMRKFPQKIVNIEHQGDTSFLNNTKLKKTVKECERKLKNKGRIVVRASGTEPVVRVMVEGEEQSDIEKIAQELTDCLEGMTKNCS